MQANDYPIPVPEEVVAAEDTVPSPEEVTASLLVSAIQKLPEAVGSAMLRDPEILAALGLPSGDFVQIWDKRFEREALIAGLRALVNGEPFKLASHDGSINIDAGRIEDGAGILCHTDNDVRFANIGVLANDPAQRDAALDRITSTGEMSASREGMWRAAAGIGPYDVSMFLALEDEIHASPEAALRAMRQDIENGGATFEGLVPLEAGHYAGLLGDIRLPDNLDAYRTDWLAMAQTLDPVRLKRLLRIAGPMTAMRSGLVAEASDGLPSEERTDLANFLASRADPFSVAAAMEIVCRNLYDERLRSLGDTLVPRLCDPEDPLILLAAPALDATHALTVALTARNRVFAGWPLYAKKLARLMHAGHLLGVFQSASVDPADFAHEVGTRFGPQARVAELCDLYQAPYYQPHHFSPQLVHAMMLDRLTSALARLDEDKRPQAWLDTAEKSIQANIDAGRGLFLFAAGPLDELEAGWSGLHYLSEENAAETLAILETDSEAENLLSELFKLSLAFDAPLEHRLATGEAIMRLLPGLDPTQYLIAAEIGLQLSARWRDTDLADRLIDELVARAENAGLVDHGSAPRLILLSAAATADRESWLSRAANCARVFANRQKDGRASLNLLRAINLLGDFEPDLSHSLAPAKGNAVLVYDSLAAQI